MTSHPVAMLLPVMDNGTFCTTTIVRKSAGCACSEHTSGHVTDVISGHVTSGDVTSGQGPMTSLSVAPSHSTTSNATL